MPSHNCLWDTSQPTGLCSDRSFIPKLGNRRSISEEHHILPLRQSNPPYTPKSRSATAMRRNETPVSGDQIQPSKQRRKRKPQSDKPESSTLSHSDSPNRGAQFLTGKSLQEAKIPEKKSDELLQAHPIKRARTGLQQPTPKPTVKENAESRPLATRLRSVQPKEPSLRQSLRLLKGGGNVALLAEPPPARRSTVTPPTEQTPSRDPESELKRRVREEFQETGDYSAFNMLLAPFIKGNTKRELSDWVYNEEKQRWCRKDRSTGLVIWAPTSDSFL